jgi:hypothetical protein
MLSDWKMIKISLGYAICLLAASVFLRHNENYRDGRTTVMGERARQKFQRALESLGFGRTKTGFVIYNSSS